MANPIPGTMAFVPARIPIRGGYSSQADTSQQDRGSRDTSGGGGGGRQGGPPGAKVPQRRPYRPGAGVRAARTGRR